MRLVLSVHRHGRELPLPALILAVLVAAGSAHAQPRGRIVWTESDGGSFAVKSTVYGPDGQPLRNAEVDAPGATVQVDDKGMIARRGTQLQASGSAPSGVTPKAELHFLHPSLDFTGRRLLYTTGKTWGPASLPPPRQAGTAATLPRVEDGTAIGYKLPGQKITDPGGSTGAAMDAFPVSDPQGEFFYFSRFFYSPGEVDLPGWYLMKVKREDAEGGGTPGASFVEAGGEKVRGSQPFVSPSGEYLLFVRRDYRNLSTDLWYLKLPPDSAPEKLFEAEGEPDFQLPTGGSSSKDDWAEYNERKGKARISHPVMDANSRFVVYACDRGQNWSQGTKEIPTWDLYSLGITRNGDGSLSAEREDEVISGADEADVDESWPSLSGDGRYVVFQSKPREAGRAPKVRIAGVPAGDGPSGDVRDVEGSREGSMWPAWDQDEDPPHVLVMLRANDGSPPLTLRILDKDPDPSAGSDVVDMSLEWATYNPSIPPPPAEAPSGLEPIDIRKDGKEEPVALEYRTEKSNSLKLVLSGETEELGDHVGFKKLYVPSGTPGEKSENAFSHDVLTSDKLKGLVIYENVRLEVRVVARDNRWRRVGPSGSGASLYSSDPIEEARQIFPEDPRAVPDGRGEAKPPYLDTIAREDNMDRGKPGISWWIEEGRKGASADDDLKPARPSFENAPHILFRAPNFPKDDSKGDDDPRNFDRYLRIVVRDLLSNVVDLRIPVLVMPKNFSVDTLESNTSRKSFGKKDS